MSIGLSSDIHTSGFTGMDGIAGNMGYGGMGYGSMGYGGMGYGVSQNQVLHQLQSILQLQMFKNFSTGNFFIDTLSQLFFMTLITYLFTQVKTLLDKAGSAISWSMNKTWMGSRWAYFKILNLPIKQIKYVEIPYISDNRKINELYKAVSWYLSTNSEIDYTKETDLQYVYEKPIVPENINFIKGNLGLNKIMSQNKRKEIKFKNYVIKYELGTELLTIYTDKEKKRENYKVKLWVEIDQFVKNDVLEEFCQLCITKFVESLTSSTWKQQIYINKEGKWTGEASNNSRKLDTIILQNSLKDEIRDDFQRFINSEEWYNSLDIPFNRGYLFYGRPGTGKTSLIRGISLHFKRHIHFLMLQNIKSDVELLELFKGINYKETILVIEDIDAMVSAVKSREKSNKSEDSDDSDDSDESDIDNSDDSDNQIKTENRKLKRKLKKLKKQKENREDKDSDKDIPSYKKKEAGFDSISNKSKKESGITLSGLLNALDGVVATPGRILIMTTNHPEILDDALIRPGRCDAKYQFDYCTKNQIKELYQMFFNQEAPLTQLSNIKASEYSPAHITAVFLRYRNEPEKALHHLDDIEQKVTIKPMVERPESPKSPELSELPNLIENIIPSGAPNKVEIKESPSINKTDNSIYRLLKNADSNKKNNTKEIISDTIVINDSLDKITKPKELVEFLEKLEVNDSDAKFTVNEIITNF